MNRKSHITSCILLLVAAYTAMAGNNVSETTPPEHKLTGNEGVSAQALFGINRSTLGEGNHALSTLKQVFESLSAGGDSIEIITVTGSSSPDGLLVHNKKLAHRRAESIANFIVEQCGVSRSIMRVKSADENWPLFNCLLPGKFSDTQIDKINNVVSTVSNLDDRERKLRNLDGGKVWKILVKDVFPSMRMAVVEVDTVAGTHTVIPDYDAVEVGEETFAASSSSEQSREAIAEVTEEIAEPIAVEGEPSREPVVETTQVMIEEESQENSPEPYHWYLKTNLPAWGMLIGNIQAEIDVADHFSVMLPIYYSGWNYFKSDLKFRTFTILPEARYWLRSDNQGFFVGAHVGFAQYNYAKGCDFRYQDHDGNTPALGGGISIGYRLPIRKNSPWQFEFSAGCGVYHLDYDIFINKPNGLLIGRNERTFFGIDNVAVSLCYRLDMTRKRKGGAK